MHRGGGGRDTAADAIVRGEGGCVDCVLVSDRVSMGLVFGVPTSENERQHEEHRLNELEEERRCRRSKPVRSPDRDIL